MRRWHHLRLGCVRIMRYHYMNAGRLYAVRMHHGTRPILGRDISWGRWHVQIAWFWWGFGYD